MLATIGYEGSTAEDFVRTLEVADVGLVIDIRERAQSRMRGFSKSSLATRLASAGIAYQHYRELGDPKPGRLAARAGNYAEFYRIFGAVMETPQAQEALKKIAVAVREQSVCLLCFERDPSHCHRSVVAATIETLTGEKVRHLGVRRFEQTQQFKGRMRHPSEGASSPEQQLL